MKKIRSNGRITSAMLAAAALAMSFGAPPAAEVNVRNAVPSARQGKTESVRQSPAEQAPTANTQVVQQPTFVPFFPGENPHRNHGPIWVGWPRSGYAGMRPLNRKRHRGIGW